MDTNTKEEAQPWTPIQKKMMWLAVATTILYIANRALELNGYTLG